VIIAQTNITSKPIIIEINIVMYGIINFLLSMSTAQIKSIEEIERTIKIKKFTPKTRAKLCPWTITFIVPMQATMAPNRDKYARNLTPLFNEKQQQNCDTLGPVSCELENWFIYWLEIDTCNHLIFFNKNSNAEIRATWMMVAREVIELNPNRVSVTNTMFGWIVHGPGNRDDHMHKELMQRSYITSKNTVNMKFAKHQGQAAMEVQPTGGTTLGRSLRTAYPDSEEV
jgi:hypothetical protein